MPKERIVTNSNTALMFSSFLHILILFAILSALFILVISKIEENLFNKEIGDNIEKQLPKMLQESDTDGKLKIMLQGAPLARMKQLYENPSEDTKIYNNWLKISMSMTVGFIFAIIFITGLFLYFTCSKMIPLGHILMENIVIFTLVGIFEGLFFLFVASKYIPVPPSLLLNRFYSDLKNW